MILQIFNKNKIIIIYLLTYLEIYIPMSYSLFFNKQKINYFIQGQDLNISFIFRNTFFVFIFYKKEKNISTLEFYKYIFIRKSVGNINTVTNIYNPNVYFLSIGFNPKLIKRKLNIHFFDLVEKKYDLKNQLLEVHNPSLRIRKKNYNLFSMFNIRNSQYKIKSKNYKLKSL